MYLNRIELSRPCELALYYLRQVPPHQKEEEKNKQKKKVARNYLQRIETHEFSLTIGPAPALAHKQRSAPEGCP